MRWLAYCLMTVSLAIAAFFEGGFPPPSQARECCAVGIGIAALLAALFSRSGQSSIGKAGVWATALLLGWMIFQLVPLPPAFVAYLSPLRSEALAQARAVTGQNAHGWAALSLAPAATIERLLDVAPAMAAFITAREMGIWWPDRMWITVAPIVGVAWLESILGIVQFSFMRAAGGEIGSAHGTYVNRDHFAGLLEMAFPIALLWSIAIWRQLAGSETQRARPAIGAVFLLTVSSCLLLGVIVSLSRMGFISTLIATGFMMILLVGSFAFGGKGERRRLHARKWLIVPALTVPLLIAIFLPTRELILRFGDLAATKEMSNDTRVEIWRDTRKVISDYKWTGTGLGALEKGIYARKTAVPDNAITFAHNDYLQILAELGIVGTALALLVAIWIGSRVLVVALWRRDSLNWPLAVGLSGALLALAVHSFADFNLYIPANALAFAWLSGVAVSPGLSNPGLR